MASSKTVDIKRSVSSPAPSQVRRAATEPPRDERHSSLVELQHKTNRVVRTAARAGVVVPIVLGVGGGLLAVSLGVDDSTITDGLIVGGVLSGLFNYGQAMAEATKDRRQLQIQLAAGTNLKNSDLARVDLSRSYLRSKDLEGARLSFATCYESDFSYCNLRDARLTEGSFTRAVFDHADMTAAGCFEARLNRCSLVQVNLQRASMCGCDLRQSDLTNADLQFADLRRARLEGCVLEGTNLEGSWYSRSTRWPVGYEPPEDPSRDLHGRVFKDDSNEEAMSVTPDVHLGSKPPRDRRSPSRPSRSTAPVNR